jgi:hypothetical protein
VQSEVWNRVPLNLVWTEVELEETDWLRYLLGPSVRHEIVARNFEFVEPNSIYVISSNKDPLLKLPRGFINALKRVRGKGLIHLSDETLRGGYEVYREFNFVLRNYDASWFRNPRIHVMPLGWNRYMSEHSSVKPVALRHYQWSFGGNINCSSRAQMMRALDKIGPKYLDIYCLSKKPVTAKGKLSRPEYRAILEDTVFAPCPAGNVVLETFRFYEALELGCIPIVETRILMPYYERLLGPSPVPKVRRWSEAASFIKCMAGDREGLVQLQNEISSWWTRRKQEEQEKIRKFIACGIHKEVSNSMVQGWNFRTTHWFQAKRILELLRHQSLGSLHRRLREYV